MRTRMLAVGPFTTFRSVFPAAKADPSTARRAATEARRRLYVVSLLVTGTLLLALSPRARADELDDLKQTIKNKPRAKTRDDLVAATASILKSIQKRPNRVKSYFHAKHVRYAA